jgi:hypothetical protein
MASFRLKPEFEQPRKGAKIAKRKPALLNGVRPDDEGLKAGGPAKSNYRCAGSGRTGILAA